MESTNNQTPARSSEEQLKAKYGGKLYRVGITVPVDDESEKEFSYYFKRPTVPSYANEVALKDEMLLMEETIINDTFLDTTSQELISYFLAQAGLSKMKLSSKTYPTRKMLPIRRQTAVQAINAVNAAWGLRVPFFFSGGVFYWDEKPEQKKVYTFERGVNILNLRRAGGVWELETVSAPFIKHSHKINLIHPQVSGEVEVSKVVSKTNDSGFIRTYIYF